ncbi:MAG TPA: phosphatidate cytidylyltransferase [Candidatus Babeliales bacterium]|nr:phosphatidate cytidylyltransferase [Candidatus Babeliales bacterium]
MKIENVYPKLTYRIITGTLLAIITLSIFYFSTLLFSLFLVSLLALILTFEWPRLCKATPILWLLTPIYPILPVFLMIIINHQSYYRWLIINLLVIIATHDTGSYIAGHFVGKHKILPHISPGKTWEGFWGGYIFVLSIQLLLLILQRKIVHPIPLIITLLIICFISLAGDLFESLLKRKAHLKDSGYFLPGHGGFLDRFDGLLFAIYFFYLFKNYLSTIF